MAEHYLVIVNGSPRRNGNCAVLVEQAAAGARANGAHVEIFNLGELNIHPCDACESCQEANGVCVIQDDMQKLYPHLRQADAILIASPIYWFSVSAQTKIFIDRCYALQGAVGNLLGAKRFGVMLTYGDVDPYTSGAVNAIRMFQDIMRYLEADLVGLVYGSANAPGEIRDRPEVLEQAYQLGQQLGS